MTRDGDLSALWSCIADRDSIPIAFLKSGILGSARGPSAVRTITRTQHACSTWCQGARRSTREIGA